MLRRDGLARQAEGCALQQLIEQQGVGDEEQDADRNEPEAVLAGVVAQHQIQQAGGEVAAHLDAERAAGGERQAGQQGVGQKQPGAVKANRNSMGSVMPTSAEVSARVSSNPLRQPLHALAVQPDGEAGARQAKHDDGVEPGHIAFVQRLGAGQCLQVALPSPMRLPST